MQCKLLLLAGFVCLSRASAQDPFEIHIYEYEPLSWREYSLEAANARRWSVTSALLTLAEHTKAEMNDPACD
jgi:hypothetical protein